MIGKSVCIGVLFFLTLPFVLCDDIIDPFSFYDFSSGVKVSYFVSYVDAGDDEDERYDVLLIRVNDSKAEVFLNGDTGISLGNATFSFTSYSVRDGDNTLEFVIYSDEGMVRSYQKNELILNKSLFSFVQDINITLNPIYDDDGFVAELIVDTGIDKEVIVYIFDAIYRGNRSVRVVPMDPVLKISSVEVPLYGHRFIINHSYDISPLRIDVCGVTETFSVEGVSLNVSCNFFQDTWSVRVYGSNDDFLLGDELAGSSELVYVLNGSFFLESMLNGPYHVYFNDQVYVTAAYPYALFNETSEWQAVFEKEEVVDSTFLTQQEGTGSPRGGASPPSSLSAGFVPMPSPTKQESALPDNKGSKQEEGYDFFDHNEGETDDAVREGMQDLMPQDNTSADSVSTQNLISGNFSFFSKLSFAGMFLGMLLLGIILFFSFKKPYK